MHIRRGDACYDRVGKCQTPSGGDKVEEEVCKLFSDRCLDFVLFADAVEKLVAGYGINAIYLASDDASAFPEMRRLLAPEIEIFGNPDVNWGFLDISEEDAYLHSIGLGVCLSVSVCVCLCACVHVCMCACAHVCTGACVHVRMCACVHVCMCACVHVRMCACVHVHLPVDVYSWYTAGHGRQRERRGRRGGGRSGENVGERGRR